MKNNRTSDRLTHLRTCYFYRVKLKTYLQILKATETFVDRRSQKFQNKVQQLHNFYISYLTFNIRFWSRYYHMTIYRKYVWWNDRFRKILPPPGRVEYRMLVCEIPEVRESVRFSYSEKNTRSTFHWYLVERVSTTVSVSMLNLVYTIL